MPLNMLPHPIKVCKYIDSRNHERSFKKVARLFKDGLDPRGIKTTPGTVYEPSFFISPIIRSLINQRQDVLNLCLETCKERSLKIPVQDYISYLSHAARYYPDAITYLFDNKSQRVTGQTGQRTEASAVRNFIENGINPVYFDWLTSLYDKPDVYEDKGHTLALGMTLDCEDMAYFRIMIHKGADVTLPVKYSENDTGTHPSVLDIISRKQIYADHLLTLLQSPVVDIIPVHKLEAACQLAKNNGAEANYHHLCRHLNGSKWQFDAKAPCSITRYDPQYSATHSLTEIFNFSADRQERISILREHSQPDQSAVLREGFSAIQNQDLIQKAAKKLQEKGGILPPDILSKTISTSPLSSVVKRSLKR